MDINCDALHLLLRNYAETADTPNGFISEVIKVGLEAAAPYKSERTQWKSYIHNNTLKENIDSPLIVSDEEVLQLHKNGIERMKSANDVTGDCQKKLPEYSTQSVSRQQPIHPPNPVQKSLHSFGFKSVDSNSCGQHKRKSDSDDDLRPNSKLMNVEHSNWGYPNSNTNSNWNPKSKWQNPRAANEPSNVSKFNPTMQLWSTLKSAQESASNGVTSNSRQFASVEVSRKYVPNHSPTTAHPNNISNYENASSSNTGVFRTAKDELTFQNIKKYGHAGSVPVQNTANKRSLGTRKGGVFGKFVPPKKISENGEIMEEDSLEQDSLEPQDERLRNIDPKMVEMIKNEIMYIGKPVEWDDIAGLEFAKSTIQEIVVWPLLRPDIFSGLRGPPKGILLFGPPGTGKTLIGKCIAAQSKSTFFSISASSLTSKWIGDGEKMVRALFAVARCFQPAVVFIDEIDSLLSQRSDTEHESSRRIKTEFLVQLDGATTAEDERILVVGATNRPQELDEAARRRLVKRLYIPLPEQPARAQMVRHLMSQQRCTLTESDIHEVAELAEGFSGADMRDLCREAAYGPIRSIDVRQMQHINPNEVRPVTLQDFRVALQQVRPSVSSKDLQSYEQWNRTYGYGNS